MKKINLTDYIRKSATQVSLSDAERERMKRVLVEYVAMKPMRNAPLARRAPLQYAFLSLYAYSRRSVALLLVFAILFSGAGVSFAAENALPGDVLYPIKVDVNEPVVAVLSVSSEAKVLWNAERAERRLEEAAKLGSEDRLSGTVRQELAVRFETQAEKVLTEVERLDSEDSPKAVDIASRFENRLLAHGVVLDDADRNQSGRTLRDRVQEKAERLSKIRARASRPSLPTATVAVLDTAEVSTMTASEPAPTSFAMKVQAPAPAAVSAVQEESNAFVRDEVVKRSARSAEKELAEAEKIFKRAQEKISAEAVERVQKEFSEARALLHDGEASQRNGDSAGAFRAYSASVAISAKSEVYLKALLQSHIKIIPEDAYVREEANVKIEQFDSDPEEEGKSVPQQATELLPL